MLPLFFVQKFMCSTKLPTALIAFPAVLVIAFLGFAFEASILAVAPSAAPAIMEIITDLVDFIVVFLSVVFFY